MLQGTDAGEHHPPLLRATVAVKRAVANRTGKTIRRRIPSLDAGLAELAAHDSPPDDAPVLILASGWRTGSTLLQRLVVSSGSVLVWGEPLAASRPVQELAKMVRPVSPKVLNPKWIIRTDDPAPLTDRFIANLYPPVSAIASAQRAFLDELFGAPARAAGFARWGVKEVRWDVGYARYFRTLYPNSRVLLLVRNPYDAFASYDGHEWFWDWPNHPVRTATGFGRIWAELAGGYLDAVDDEGVRLVRYEDLVSDPGVVGELESFLDLDLDRSVLGVNPGSSTRSVVSRRDRRALERVVGEVAARYGYEPA